MEEVRRLRIQQRIKVCQFLCPRHYSFFAMHTKLESSSGAELQGVRHHLDSIMSSLLLLFRLS